MFIFSEIYHAHEPYSVRFFKPWWDIVIDYLTMALLVISLLSFTRVIFEDNFGVTSIGVNHTLPLWEAQYVSSRCSHVFEGRFLVYYPYLLFLEWIFITIIHYGWLTLPAVSSKLESFYSIFNGMCKTQPKFYRNPNTLRMPSELKFVAENKEKIELLHYRLLYLLTSKSFLTKVYQIKTYTLVAYSFCVTCLVIMAPVKFHGFRSDFECNLREIPGIAIGFNTTLCHFQPAFFTYGVMVGNILLFILITGMSLNGIFWLLHFNSINDGADISETMSEYYGGLPGFNDFRFCMMLVQVNIRDGKVMLETIKNCINSQAKKFREFNYARRGKLDESTLVVVPTRLLEDSKLFVLWIAEQLGLEELENSQGSNHLFECIEVLKDSLGYIDIDIQSSMREHVVNEIERNPQVFKTVIDEYEENDFESLIVNLRNLETYGRQYCLMAAATMLHIRIVIIHCHPTKNVQEVFLPYRNRKDIGMQDNKPIQTRFLTFISPQYYHVTVDLPVTSDWPSIVTKRRMYASDSSFRASMRNAAVRCIDTTIPFQKTRKLNPYTKSKDDAVTTIEMPVMGLKRKM